MTAKLEIRIVGPQFGELSLIMKWLAREHQTHLLSRGVADHDVLLELAGTDQGTPFRVVASKPAIWDREAVYGAMFSRVHAVLMVFTRISSLVHLNAVERDAIMPYLQAALPERIMIANNARCGELIPWSKPLPNRGLRGIGERAAGLEMTC